MKLFRNAVRQAEACSMNQTGIQTPLAAAAITTAPAATMITASSAWMIRANADGEAYFPSQAPDQQALVQRVVAEEAAAGEAQAVVVGALAAAGAPVVGVAEGEGAGLLEAEGLACQHRATRLPIPTAVADAPTLAPMTCYGARPPAARPAATAASLTHRRACSSASPTSQAARTVRRVAWAAHRPLRDPPAQRAQSGPAALRLGLHYPLHRSNAGIPRALRPSAAPHPLVAMHWYGHRSHAITERPVLQTAAAPLLGLVKAAYLYLSAARARGAKLVAQEGAAGLMEAAGQGQAVPHHCPARNRMLVRRRHSPPIPAQVSPAMIPFRLRAQMG